MTYYDGRKLHLAGLLCEKLTETDAAVCVSLTIFDYLQLLTSKIIVKITKPLSRPNTFGDSEDYAEEKSNKAIHLQCNL